MSITGGGGKPPNSPPCPLTGAVLWKNFYFLPLLSSDFILVVLDILEVILPLPLPLLSRSGRNGLRLYRLDVEVFTPSVSTFGSGSRATKIDHFVLSILFTTDRMNHTERYILKLQQQITNDCKNTFYTIFKQKCRNLQLHHRRVTVSYSYSDSVSDLERKSKQICDDIDDIIRRIDENIGSSTRRQGVGRG